MEEIYKIGEDLIEHAIKKIKNEEFQIASDIFQKALNIYNHSILEEYNTKISSELYFKRAIIYKHLGSGLNSFRYSTNYYLDIRNSMTLGNNEAKIIYESSDFKEEFKPEKITFFFEVSEINNYLEFSSLFIKGHYFNADKVNIKSNEKLADVTMSDFLDVTCDNINYKKIILRLIHGIATCDNFVCFDLNQTKNILKKHIQNQHNFFDGIFTDPKGISLKSEIVKKSNLSLNECKISDVFNVLFDKKINDTINSELNVLITSDCYRLISYLNKYPFLKEKTPKLKDILNL